jgi:hypothetical protein
LLDELQGTQAKRGREPGAQTCAKVRHRPEGVDPSPVYPVENLLDSVRRLVSKPLSKLQLAPTQQTDALAHFFQTKIISQNSHRAKRDGKRRSE